MTGKQLWIHWLDFWFAPQSPTPVALFRIVFGLLLLQMMLVHTLPNWLFWYGPHSIVSLESIKAYWWQGQPHFDLFLLAPRTAAGSYTVAWIFVVAAVCLTIGLCTRYASIVVCLILISMQNHMPFNINGGDAMLRLYSMYLLVTDAGGAFSVDRLMQRWRSPTMAERSLPKLSAPWGQRMIQVQLAIAYWDTFAHKIIGPQWLDGTAVYYALRLEDMRRFSLPFINTLWIAKFLTWYTLVVEFALFTLVWLKDMRYWVLASAVILHLGIDVTINLPVFEWAFMAGFITFITPEDLRKVMGWINENIASRFGPATSLTWNQESLTASRWASVIEGLDVCQRLALAPAAGAEGGSATVLTASTACGELKGAALFYWLTARLPLLWPLYPFIGLPFQLAQQRKKQSVQPG